MFNMGLAAVPVGSVVALAWWSFFFCLITSEAMEMFTLGFSAVPVGCTVGLAWSSFFFWPHRV